MLQEGIQASLVRGPHSVLRAHHGCLSPVSSLRLQQLEHMDSPQSRQWWHRQPRPHGGCRESLLAGGVGGKVSTEVLVTQGRGCLPTPKGPGPLQHRQTLR